MSDAEYAYDLMHLKLCMITQLSLDCDIKNIIKKTLYQCSFDVIKAPPIEYLYRAVKCVASATITYQSYNYHVRLIHDTPYCLDYNTSYIGYNNGVFTYRYAGFYIRAYIIANIHYIKNIHMHDGIICYLL